MILNYLIHKKNKLINIECHYLYFYARYYLKEKKQNKCLKKLSPV